MQPYRELAIFDANGHLLAHTEMFYLELPLDSEEILRDAVFELNAGEVSRLWLLINGRRVLLQALAGPTVTYAATVQGRVSNEHEAREILSPRQLEIAEYAAAGATASEIAEQLLISIHTVRQHIKEVYRRLHVGNRIELSKILADGVLTKTAGGPPARIG